MTPIPNGRQAILAWRSLTPQAREHAWAAAQQGIALADPGVALVVAGYGRTMVRRLLPATLVPQQPYVPATAVIFLVLAFSGVPRAVALLVFAVLMVASVGYAILLVVRRWRFQRLYDSGMLGITAARLWAPQRIPAGGSPVACPRPDPTRTHTVQISAGPVTRSIVAVTLFSIFVLGNLIWDLVTRLRGTVEGVTPVGLGLLIVVFALFFALLLVVYVRHLLDPVVARFTAEGWEAPGRRIRGPWSQVRAIRIRAGSTRPSGFIGLSGAGTCVVALLVDDPERYLAQMPPLSRILARRAMRWYGSPVTIVARPGWTVPIADLTSMLRNYTDAPLDLGS